MLELLAFLEQPFVVLGAILGVAIGVMLAAALHWLYPEHRMVVLQAILVAAGFIVGLLAGSAVQNRR